MSVIKMIDISTIIVALLSLIGTIIGSLGGMKLMTYRIEQLEQRVNKHNNLIERTFILERDDKLHEEQIKVINHRLEDLEKCN
jgi:ABC-type phosphate transport system auxiliary subunit